MNRRAIDDFLSPASLIVTEPPTFDNLIKECFVERLLPIVPPDGSQDGIGPKLEALLSNVSDANALIDLEKQHQLISGGKSKGQLSYPQVNDDYWKRTDCANLDSIIPEISGKNKTVTVFLTRNHRTSPATRGTPQVDFFLNYTPPTVASQMVPFLDVEFHLLQPNSPGVPVNTPGMIRYLVGSLTAQQAETMLSPLDKGIYLGNRGSAQGATSENMTSMFAGMEMFLLPQTLTNYDNLFDVGGSRLVPAKPFTSFASIEGVDITVQNGGAGTFTSRKAVLKLKIHDKGRLAEISNFISLGGRGYQKALIWLTYGWVAPYSANPQNDGRGDNAYFDFINNNMIKREPYRVVNTNYSFDARGQVSLNIEMMSAASVGTEKLMMGGDEDTRKKFEDLNSAVTTISEIMGKGEGLNVSTSMQQVLNVAGGGGSFADIKDVNVGKVIDAFVESQQKNTNLAAEDLEKLKDALGKLKGDGAAKGYGYEQATRLAAANVKKQLDDIGKGPDPFLAVLTKEGTGASVDTLIKYFGSNLPEVIYEYKGRSTELNKTIAGIKAAEPNNVDVMLTSTPGEPVVSFGKLFLKFVVPAMVADSNLIFDELQVVFYAMNSSCGPMSGRNIAEFPIDMLKFSHDYAEALKQSGGAQMTVQDFLRLLINTQFCDPRAIGYGRNKLYKPWDPRKKEPEAPDKNRAAETEKDENAWIQKYKELKIPVIEFQIESSNATTDPLTRYIKTGGQHKQPQNGTGIIKRIHIYDKTASPHTAAQQIINAGPDGSFASGVPNFDALDSLLSKYPKEDLEKLKGAIEEAKRTGKLEKIYENLREKNLDPSQLNVSVIEGANPNFTKLKFTGPRDMMRQVISKTMPTLTVGTNGTMIISAQVSSKTDGALGAMRVIDAMRGNSGPGATMSENGLSNVNNTPIEVIPAQLTMTTVGVPTAQPYQEFFIDFGTGVSIDNIWKATAVQHSISQGKFTTQWTFARLDAYAKYRNPPSIEQIITGHALSKVEEMITEQAVAKQLGVKGQQQGKKGG